MFDKQGVDLAERREGVLGFLHRDAAKEQRERTGGSERSGASLQHHLQCFDFAGLI